MSNTLTPFEELILASSNQLGAPMLLILAWISQSDGELSLDEVKRLKNTAEGMGVEKGNELITRLAQSQDLAALQLSIEVLQAQLSQDQKTLLVQMAIGMALADRRLFPSENHILRFLSDALGFTPRQFSRIYLEACGNPLPEPSDLSDRRTWTRQRSSSSSSGRNDRGQKHANAWAYSILGLAVDVGESQVKLAYRRLAQIHHPDRYASLGEEAVATATETFKRIQQAYEAIREDFT